MPDYKETTVSGKTWVRAGKVEITNPLGKVPVLSFIEEQITTTETGTITQFCGSCGVVFDQTNAKHVALYTALNELYVEAREARDARRTV